MSTPQPLTVVTGASGALGSALLAHLTAAGHRIAAIERSPGRLAELSHEGVMPILLEPGAEDAWARAAQKIQVELGTPTGAVLAAGGWAGGAKLFEEAGRNSWRKMLDQNLESARLSLEALLPLMVSANRGSVVLVGSRAAVRPWESAGSAAYAVSKAAALALTQAAAAEVLDAKVRVNMVLPSTIDTPNNRTAMPKADTSRWVGLDSLCGVIAFLLSDAARDVSGAALPVYGRA